MNSTVREINLTLLALVCLATNIGWIIIVSIFASPRFRTTTIVAILERACAGWRPRTAKLRKISERKRPVRNYLGSVFDERMDGWVKRKNSAICEKISERERTKTPTYYEQRRLVFLSSKNVH